MNLQKKLIQLSEYKCSFKYVDSYFLVSMTYPENWSIIPSEDRTIEVAEENGVTFYAAPIETDIEIAFTLIDDTISYNLDVEKKMALLKYNIGKLQELFAEKDLAELETIEFVFKPQKEKTIAKPTVKKTAKTTKKITRKPTVRKKKEESQPNEDNVVLKDNIITNEPDMIFTEDVEVPITVSENKYLEEVER